MISIIIRLHSVIKFPHKKSGVHYRNAFVIRLGYPSSNTVCSLAVYLSHLSINFAALFPHPVYLSLILSLSRTPSSCIPSFLFSSILPYLLSMHRLSSTNTPCNSLSFWTHFSIPPTPKIVYQAFFS